MGRKGIPVDLRNPGQVFACLGFLEAADILCGPAEGGFDWRNGEKFVLDAAGAEDPVAAVLAFLCDAEVIWSSPSDCITERDGGKTVAKEGISASSVPKAADLPGSFVGWHEGVAREIPFGYWADGTSRFHEIFKKSTYANSCHIRMENALRVVRSLDSKVCADDPLGQSAVTRSLFRLDPRGSTDPIQDGTSPDTLRKGGIEMRVVTYPLCELMAIIGLQNARPKILSRTHYCYKVWSCLHIAGDHHPIMLSPILARAALGSDLLYLRTRAFVIEHEEVKAGGDRRITKIRESTSNE